MAGDDIPSEPVYDDGARYLEKSPIKDDLLSRFGGSALPISREQSTQQDVDAMWALCSPATYAKPRK